MVTWSPLGEVSSVARVDMKRRLGGLARQLAQLLLTLPPNEPQRPHPALLYILLAEAVRILERSIPRPQLPRPPTSLFPQTFSPLFPGTPVDPGYILSHV
jgi:hypothetical protein